MGAYLLAVPHRDPASGDQGCRRFSEHCLQHGKHPFMLAICCCASKQAPELWGCLQIFTFLVSLAAASLCVCVCCSNLWALSELECGRQIGQVFASMLCAMHWGVFVFFAGCVVIPY